ncbi:amidohydrolase [Pedobacter alpinus]|uniref:Amidohydrolase n=1 Tax=Pedobacter alpinus TaxID=1590643 RepID=A0ABW5TU28_9SPHI
MNNRLVFSILLLFALSACQIKKHADFIIINAKIYTLDSNFTVAQALAVSDGKIIATGTNEEMQALFKANEEIDAEGKTIVPGFIDAHAHFLRYGEGLQELNLRGTKSWAQIVAHIKAYTDKNKEGWIIGRGWDQNDWDVKNFPNKEVLDSLYPNRPIILTRIDGHAAIANQIALDSAKITIDTKLTGGDVIVENGKLTGLLIDNAVDLVSSKIPKLNNQQKTKSLIDAANNCFAVGLTTVDDCGLDYKDVLLIDSLQKTGDLKMRLYAMLSDAQDNYDFLIKKGKIKTKHLNVRSFKVYGDGALGSRGACLLKPYSDKKDHLGFLLSDENHFKEVAQKIYDNDFQMCTHAIGDSANRTILKIYESVLKGKNDKRWRIEHAQIVNPADFKLFGDNSIIPSVQPTHATSDMYWAANRLGNQRVKSAYAYLELLNQNNWLPLGTDFPVEDINPINTFYAAVSRKDLENYPKNGFQMENALSREQALKGMTIWAAKSNFEEHEKGSLEKGKFADFIILNQDMMTIEDNKIPLTKVLTTYIAGKKVYQK